MQKEIQKIVEVVAALIWQDGKFLICQRPKQKVRGLLWEFVGGKVEQGETHIKALVRECREELDITVSVGELYMQLLHVYPDITIKLSLYLCEIQRGVPKCLEHNDLRWITPEEIPNFCFCPADTEILNKIQNDYLLTDKDNRGM